MKQFGPRNREIDCQETEKSNTRNGERIDSGIAFVNAVEDCRVSPVTSPWIKKLLHKTLPSRGAGDSCGPDRGLIKCQKPALRQTVTREVSKDRESMQDVEYINYNDDVVLRRPGPPGSVRGAVLATGTLFCADFRNKSCSRFEIARGSECSLHGCLVGLAAMPETS